MNYYTTIQLAELTPYKTRRTLLQALHNNRRKNLEDRDVFLDSIWKSRFRFGKKWVFNQNKINNIINNEK